MGVKSKTLCVLKMFRLDLKKPCEGFFDNYARLLKDSLASQGGVPPVKCRVHQEVYCSFPVSRPFYFP
jgi:hypothetical protein